MGREWIYQSTIRPVHEYSCRDRRETDWWRHLLSVSRWMCYPTAHCMGDDVYLMWFLTPRRRSIYQYIEFIDLFVSFLSCCGLDDWNLCPRRPRDKLFFSGTISWLALFWRSDNTHAQYQLESIHFSYDDTYLPAKSTMFTIEVIVVSWPMWLRFFCKTVMLTIVWALKKNTWKLKVKLIWIILIRNLDCLWRSC